MKAKSLKRFEDKVLQKTHHLDTKVNTEYKVYTTQDIKNRKHKAPKLIKKSTTVSVQPHFPFTKSRKRKE